MRMLSTSSEFARGVAGVWRTHIFIASVNLYYMSRISIYTSAKIAFR